MNLPRAAIHAAPAPSPFPRGSAVTGGARRPAPALVGAAHEAGHAVVAEALGLSVLSVSVKPDGSGRCRHSSPPGGGPQSLRAQLVVTMAGIAGELVGGYQREWRAMPDLRDADGIVRRLTRDPAAQLDAVRRALAEALAILVERRAEHRTITHRLIERIA